MICVDFSFRPWLGFPLQLPCSGLSCPCFQNLPKPLLQSLWRQSELSKTHSRRRKGIQPAVCRAGCVSPCQPGFFGSAPLACAQTLPHRRTAFAVLDLLKRRLRLSIGAPWTSRLSAQGHLLLPLRVDHTAAATTASPRCAPKPGLGKYSRIHCTREGLACKVDFGVSASKPCFSGPSPIEGKPLGKDFLFKKQRHGGKYKLGSCNATCFTNSGTDPA